MVRIGKTKRDQLEDILRELINIGNMEGAAIVSRNGLLIADMLPKNIDPEIFSSMTATMHGAAETTIEELKKGTCLMSMAESEESIVIANGIDPMFLLVAIAQKNVNLGLLRIEMKRQTELIISML